MNRAERRKAAKQNKKMNEENLRRTISLEVAKSGLDAATLINNRSEIEGWVRDRIKQREQYAKNGITLNDLRKEYDRGYKEAVNDVSLKLENTYVAALLLALHETYGFGKQRCMMVAKEMCDIAMKEICADDLLNRLRDEVGIDLKSDEYNELKEVV